MIPVRVVLLSPPPSPSRWKVGGGGGGGLGKGEGRVGGSWFAGASRDACFLLSGPKWNPDKNTPLVAACRLWVAAVSEVIGRGRQIYVSARVTDVAEGYRKARLHF